MLVQIKQKLKEIQLKIKFRPSTDVDTKLKIKSFILDGNKIKR